MRCDKCGQLVPDGSAFCNHCGHPMNSLTTCPTCGQSIPANSVFCPKCGKMVRDDMLDDAEPDTVPQAAAAGTAGVGATYNEIERERRQHHHAEQTEQRGVPYYPDHEDEEEELSSEPVHFTRNVIIGFVAVAAIIGALLLMRNCGGSNDDRHAVTGSDSTLLVADSSGDPMSIFTAELSRNNFTGDGAVAAHAVKVPGNGADRPEVIMGVTTKNDAETRSFFKIYKLTQNGQVWMPELQHTQYLNGRTVNMDNSAMIADIQNVPRAVKVGDKDYYYFAYLNMPTGGGTMGRVSLCLWDVDDKKLTTLDYDGALKSRDDGRQYVYGKPLQAVNSPETRFLQSEARNIKIIYFPTEEELKAEQEAREKEEEAKRLADPDNVDERWNQENEENVEALKKGEEVTIKAASYDKPIFNMKEINKKIENEGYIVFSIKNGAVYGFNKNTRKYFSIYSPKGDSNQPSDIGFADSKNNLMRMRTGEGRFSYDLVTGKTKRIPD